MLWDLNEFILVKDYLDFHSTILYYTYRPGLQDRRSLRLSWTVIGQVLSSARWGLLLIDRCWYDKQDLAEQYENRRKKNMLVSYCFLELIHIFKWPTHPHLKWKVSLKLTCLLIWQDVMRHFGSVPAGESRLVPLCWAAVTPELMTETQMTKKLIDNIFDPS